MVSREFEKELQKDDRVGAQSSAGTGEFEAPKGSVVTTDRFEEVAKAALADVPKERELVEEGKVIPSDIKLAEALTSAEKAVENGKQRVAEEAEDARANIVEKLGVARERAPQEGGGSGAPENKEPATPTEKADATPTEEAGATPTEETEATPTAEEDITKETTGPEVEEAIAKSGSDKTRLILILVVAAALLAAFWFISSQHRGRTGGTGSATTQNMAATTSKTGESKVSDSKETGAVKEESKEAATAGTSEGAEEAAVEDTPISLDLEWDSADDMPTIMTEATEPIGMAILQHAELGRGIGAIMQVPTLTIPEESGLAGVSDAGEFEDSVWYEEGGSKKTYADALIACIITYYNDLYNAGDEKHLDVLEIGEIRQSGDAFFAATRIHEHSEPHDEAGEVTIVTDTLKIRTVDKKATVEERETAVTSTSEGEDA